MENRNILLVILLTSLNLNVSLAQTDTILIEEINELDLLDLEISSKVDTKLSVLDSGSFL